MHPQKRADWIGWQKVAQGYNLLARDYREAGDHASAIRCQKSAAHAATHVLAFSGAGVQPSYSARI